MTYSRAYLIKFLADYVRPFHPELEAPLLDALSSLDSGVSPSVAVLNSVVEAASSTNTSVSEIGAEILGELAERDSNALNAVQQMAKSKKLLVRHNALMCLTSKTPIEPCLALIRNALLDKSTKVRGKAADWAGRLRLKAVLSDLANAELAERDQKTRAIISNELRLLRDGYLVEPAGEDATFVTVRAASGQISQIVPNRIIERRGIDVIATELSGPVL